ncbi:MULTISPECIES: cytochrome d ubiquinol oxidase subunit II [Rhizobium]|uniref:Cytochrome bd-I oxidase subunit II n=1 Tax=Rhizobium favelukesii TaxID=348824 RepID=W6RI89_9HYPH|nr:MULTISPECIES: cytochrome d ubiquinol oxidase subunit II [Rhizobium]MCA0802523.1 cytochrome d ubiquinol oxidase subunit II [Rhizobium sp. T1473]MCS0460465.1 cytochrome d ubiquinol oxidase subunit II [Rhizobium favelukesii]UFS83883.1 cytochrome d ubiquinol oxidase subunit II [Rhizobium sp. T136]CDM58483.1 cytochrome bd-I oxidase subunit II [Rhizobium favelukesii]
MVLYELIDYEILRLIWWLLLGVLLIGFAATDGFDLGVGTLLPFVAKTDTERRVAINTIGPVWEGNQVWLIVGGAATFAAWPPLYAVSFSGFYLAMFAILFALILRPVGFKYRSKRESARWRNNWDWALFVGGFVPSLIFGVAVGNVLQGVPFRFDPADMRIFYEGSFFGLLNPYALLCGLLSVAMFVMHGASWLVLKASGTVAERARRYGSLAALAVIVLFALGGIFLALGVSGYSITSEINRAGPSNPLLKTATHDGSWLANYGTYAWMLIAPVLGFLGAAAAFLALRAKWEVATLLFSKLSIFGIISTVGLSMFPFILPSSLDPRSSLTVWDASSSHITLFVMLVVSLIFLPIIVAYTAWVYKVLWGKVDEETVNDKSGHAY